MGSKYVSALNILRSEQTARSAFSLNILRYFPNSFSQYYQ